MDQTEWQETTTWRGAGPLASDVWRRLAASGALRPVAETSARSSGALRGGLIQALADGPDGGEMGQRVHDLIGYRPSQATIEAALGYRLHPAQWKIRFANLVSGRFTELVFQRRYEGPLEAVGLRLVEETEFRSFIDFRLVDDDGPDIAVNLKNAGVQMEKAESFFGLAPEDTIPMATYKAFGAYEQSIATGVPVVYVYLVDWGLLARLRDAYWDSLTDDEKWLFRVLTSFTGYPRALEDVFVEWTVGSRLDDLLAGVGYGPETPLPFRAISAGRFCRIFYSDKKRSPYVYVTKMNTDPNVHASVSRETVAFDDLLAGALATRETRTRLVGDLARTSGLSVPDPPL